MKKTDIRKLKEVTLPREMEYTVPVGWTIIKEPTKILENGNECFKIVIGRA
jgi:hypothetical protein